MASRRVTKSVMSESSRDARGEHVVSGSLCACELHVQNALFAGTGGISSNNRGAGFLPGYKNMLTGESVLSRFADGSPAPVHVLDGLPAEWVAARDDGGHVYRVHDAVVAGFIRDGVFYTREAAAQSVAAGSSPDV